MVRVLSSHTTLLVTTPASGSKITGNKCYLDVVCTGWAKTNFRSVNTSRNVNTYINTRLVMLTRVLTHACWLDRVINRRLILAYPVVNCCSYTSAALS